MTDEAPKTTVAAFARLFGVDEDEVRRLSRKGILPPIVGDRLPMGESISKMAKFCREDLVTAEEGGTRLGVTARWVRQLQRDGYIRTASKGMLPFREIAAGYVGWLKDDARRSSKSATVSRVQEARAKEIELRLARDARELIPLESSFAVVDFIVGAVRSEIDGFPAKFTRDISLRRKLEEGLDEILAGACRRIAESRRALEEGRDPIASGDEDDAGRVGEDAPRLPKKRGRPRGSRTKPDALRNPASTGDKRGGT